MEAREFGSIDRIAGQAYDKCEEVLRSSVMADVRKTLFELQARYPRYGFNLEFLMELVDSENDVSLHLFHMVMDVDKDGRLDVGRLESLRRKYSVHGEICTFPDNLCPECWGQWPFKGNTGACPQCGSKWGEDVKLYLDSDECPYCWTKGISITAPKCKNCSFEATPDEVVWG